MFLQVGLASEAEPAGRAVEVALALVVDGAAVVLERGLVGERCSADVAVEDVTRVSS